MKDKLEHNPSPWGRTLGKGASPTSPFQSIPEPLFLWCEEKQKFSSFHHIVSLARCPLVCLREESNQAKSTLNH